MQYLRIEERGALLVDDTHQNCVCDSNLRLGIVNVHWLWWTGNSISRDCVRVVRQMFVFHCARVLHNQQANRSQWIRPCRRLSVRSLRLLAIYLILLLLRFLLRFCFIYILRTIKRKDENHAIVDHPWNCVRRSATVNRNRMTQTKINYWPTDG